MEWFKFLRALQTDVAISGCVITFICVRALWEHRKRYSEDGYMTLLGLAVKWLPASIVYCWLAYGYWITDINYILKVPDGMRVMFHSGLITGSAILIARFQPWFPNRGRVFVIWSLSMATFSLVMMGI